MYFSKLLFTFDIHALGEPEEHASYELTKLGEFYYNIIYLSFSEDPGEIGDATILVCYSYK